MKKILVLVFVLVGAAGAVFYLNRPSGPSAGEYYADYLPQDTLATVSLIDLKGLSETFPLSSLGKFFAKPSMHAMLTELGVPAEGIQDYDAFYDGVAGVMTNPAFRQIFGDDAVAAILMPDAALLQSAPEKELQDSLLVFGTSSVSGPLDSFARLVMSKKVEKQTVDGLEVTRIQLDENEVIYGYTENGVVILAYDAGNISQAVQQQKAGGSLQDFTFFTAAKTFWGTTGAGRQYTQTYVNIAQVRDLFAASGEKDSVQAAALLQGFKGLSSVVVEKQDELRLATRVEYDYDGLNELVKDQYKAVSRENVSLGLLTPKVLVYYWVSLLDKEYFQQLVSATDEEQYKQVNAQIKKELGLSLDELIGAVGPQFGLTINEIVNAGLFPLPKVVLYLQIRDHKAALSVVDRLRKDIASRGFAAEQSEEVNGQTIYYWTVLPGEATQPALVLTENMLYVANGKSTLAALVAREKELETLPTAMADTLGDNLVQDIAASNYTTFVMRPAQLADQVKDAADFLAGILQSSKGVSAQQLKQKLLQLMKSVDIVTATSNIQKDFALSSIVIKQAAGESAAAKK